MVNRQGDGARSGKVLHHRSLLVRERAVILAFKHTPAIRRTAVSECDTLRQHQVPAQARDGAVRDHIH